MQLLLVFSFAGKLLIIALMSTERDYDNFSITPERDELVTHTKRKRGNSRSTTSAKTPVPQGSSGESSGVKSILFILVLGLLGTAAGAYYFYDQGLQTQAALELSNNRIAQLENRLNMVDEATEQSSLSLLERVDFNFSEIDKLWAARNALRSTLGATNTTIENQAESITEIETAIANQASMNNQQAASLDQSEQALEAVRTQLNALNNTVNGLNNLNISQQLASINRDLETIKASIPAADNGLADRVNINEQDIESINLYRLNLNQTINSLQQSLNELEERVARSSAF